VDSRNHVCQLAASPPDDIGLIEVGWKQASVFPGYCAKHDSEVFEPLERFPFTGTHEQCVLQSYRSVCNELYRKRAFIDSLVSQRDVLDRGCALPDQISRQLSIVSNIEGQSRSDDTIAS
jgi:hypothetical protein